MQNVIFLRISVVTFQFTKYLSKSKIFYSISQKKMLCSYSQKSSKTLAKPFGNILERIATAGLRYCYYRIWSYTGEPITLAAKFSRKFCFVLIRNLHGVIIRSLLCQQKNSESYAGTTKSNGTATLAL